MKRFNLFILVSLSLTAFLAGYLLIRGDLTTENTTGTILDKFTVRQPEVKKQPEKGTPFLVTDRKVISPATASNKNGVVFFEKNTGKIFEYNLTDKKETELSDSPLANFLSAIWSPGKESYIGSFISQAGSSFKYFDMKTDKALPLDKNIRSFSFSPSGDLVAFYYKNETNPENNSDLATGKIVISQPDGNYPKKLLETRIEDIKISWPAKDRIVLKTPLSELYFLSEEGGFSKFLDSRMLLEENWSRNGTKLLFSSLEGEILQLFLKDAETREERPLGIEGNASKCVWSIDNIQVFCALTKSPSADEIFSINTSDGSYKLVSDPGIQAKELLLSSGESILLFINPADDKLYGIEL